MLLLISLLLSQLIMLITFQVSFLLPKYVLKNPEKMMRFFVHLCNSYFEIINYFKKGEIMMVMMHNLSFNNTPCQLNAKQYRESIKTKW